MNEHTQSGIYDLAQTPSGEIIMDSAILDLLNNTEKEVNSEVIKTRKSRKKKTDTKTLPTINEGRGK